jgi:hypothetical protein
MMITGCTYVGKKELNEQALRWKFCIKQNNQVLGSLQACLRPSIMLTSSVESPTRSRCIRACASSRSRGVSQRVVSGVLGSTKNPTIATKAVAAPSLSKTLAPKGKEQGNLKTGKDLQDEQPPPSRNPSHSIHLKHSRSNQAAQPCSENLRTVQQRNARCNFSPRVKN